MKGIRWLPKKRAIPCRNFLNDGTKRPMVFLWIPAISTYFDDPDGHSLEFVRILDGSSKPENRIISYEKWKALENKHKSHVPMNFW
ncbi:MAG: hypothetical protein ACRBFS_05740 [Aureispira sp.]